MPTSVSGQEAHGYYNVILLLLLWNSGKYGVWNILLLDGVFVTVVIQSKIQSSFSYLETVKRLPSENILQNKKSKKVIAVLPTLNVKKS